MLEHANLIKNTTIGVIGVMGSVISMVLGPWNSAVTALCVMMIADFVSGLVIAAVFKASPKSESGGLSSATGWKGLCKKIMTLALVAVGHYLDIALGIDFIRNAVVYAFMANELISIIENAGLMGIPIPKALSNAIDILKEKADETITEEIKGENE